MDKKKYIRLLRPVTPIKFNAFWVYSYLFSRPRKKGYSQRFLARYLGLAPNTIATVRDDLLALKLISLTPRRRLKAIEPPADMFQKTKGNNFAYTKVYLPGKSCPLTTKQNAVYWCWSSSRDRGKWIGPKTIARYLGISRNCAKSALVKVYGYKPNPADYQDAPQKTTAQIKLQGIAREMAEAKYTEKQILEVMGTARNDEALVARFFKEAQTDNNWAKYTTSFGLMNHRLRKYQNRPVPLQPPTVEELDSRQPSDPLLDVSEDAGVDPSWFFRRIDDFSSIHYFRWIKQHSRDILLAALHRITFQQPVLAKEFDQMLPSHCENADSKV